MKHLLIIAAFIVSCGKDNSSSNPATPADSKAPEEVSSQVHSMAIKDRSKLPECSEEMETALAYIKSEKIFLVCEDSEWVKTEINQTKSIANETLANGEFVEDGVTYFFAESVTQPAANVAVCPSSHSRMTEAEEIDLIDSGILFKHFPALEIGSSVICVGSAYASSYVTGTKIYNGSGSCKVICKK